MKRSLETLTIVILAAAGLGCSMCQHPYDYTGPVQGHGGCPNCGYNYRQGSIISGPPGAAAPTYQGTPTIQNAPPYQSSAVPTPARPEATTTR